MKKSLHFRVDTPSFLKEVFECGAKMGVFKIPANIFQNLLAQTAQRATELNDPIMNKCMWDLGLYDHPIPTNPEYTKIMKQIYKDAEKQIKKEKQLKQSLPVK